MLLKSGSKRSDEQSTERWVNHVGRLELVTEGCRSKGEPPGRDRIILRLEQDIDRGWRKVGGSV